MTILVHTEGLSCSRHESTNITGGRGEHMFGFNVVPHQLLIVCVIRTILTKPHVIRTKAVASHFCSNKTV